jgi:hypothetical protein
MSCFTDLFGDFKGDLGLMKEGLQFAQSTYKGIGLLKELANTSGTSWPGEAGSIIDSFGPLNRMAENLTYDGMVVLLAANYEVSAREIVIAICNEIESKIPNFDALADKIKSENAKASG